MILLLALGGVFAIAACGDGDGKPVPANGAGLPKLTPPATPPPPQETRGPIDTLPAMRQLIETSVSILNDYWTGLFQQTYRSPKTAGGYYAAPRGVYASLQGLECGGRSLRAYNAYWCSNGDDPYIAWEENFLDTEARKTGSGATVWLLVAHEWGHHIQWLLDVQYAGNDPDAYELGADCLAGAVSGQVARQGYYSADRLIGSLATLGNIADAFTDQGHGTAIERRNFFLRGFNGGAKACINPNR